MTLLIKTHTCMTNLVFNYSNDKTLHIADVYQIYDDSNVNMIFLIGKQCILNFMKSLNNGTDINLFRIYFWRQISLKQSNMIFKKTLQDYVSFRKLTAVVYRFFVCLVNLVYRLYNQVQLLTSFTYTGLLYTSPLTIHRIKTWYKDGILLNTCINLVHNNTHIQHFFQTLNLVYMPDCVTFLSHHRKKILALFLYK